MRQSALFKMIIFLILVSATPCPAQEPHTAFQSGRAWSPELNLPLDLAMVYSTNPDTIRSWADHGFETWVMLGASWLSKEADVVVNNPGMSQAISDGTAFEMIPGRAWMVPAQPWIDYINGRVDEALAGGASGILPEEPEFFATTGYSDAFKAAWDEYYGEPWQPPHESVENNWRANRLKAILFEIFFAQVCSHVKDKNFDVKCIVPVHSNLNYTDWRIVAPHHAFSTTPYMDGFIAQVWTGTAKHPHLVGGRPEPRTFDYAFLEYASYEALLRDADKQLWLLTDPVEDAKGADWSDLRSWYEDTLIAALLQPDASHFECLPWPGRVLLPSDLYGGGPIPQDYATELLTLWTAQRKITGPAEYVEPVYRDIAFLTADSAMWQRGLGMDRFSGHVAPMLTAMRQGMSPRVLHAERFSEPDFPPADIKVIVASFDAWKPVSQEIVAGMAQWVKSGGVLFFLGGADDYDDMPGAWWRKQGFETPADAFLSELGLSPKKRKSFMPKTVEGFNSAAMASAQTKTLQPGPDAFSPLSKLGDVSASLPITAYAVDGVDVFMTMGGKPVIWKTTVGKGTLLYAGISGEFVAAKQQGEQMFMTLLNYLIIECVHGALLRPETHAIRRGPLLMGRGTYNESYIDGPFIDLLNPDLPVQQQAYFSPGKNVFMLDVKRAVAECARPDACILHASANVDELGMAPGNISFHISGPQGRFGYVWIKIQKDTRPEADSKFEPLWDAEHQILRLLVPLSPDGITVEVN